MNSFSPVSAEKTMELLWSRVRQRGDLPGFSKVVNAIIGAMHDDDDREFNLTKTVLQDPALTQKVLRLANSAMYSVFGQDINTVSKAVIVLGTEAIGHLALGLKLIDGLSAASATSPGARAEMEKAVLAGYIARQVVGSAGSRDAEEAVVCSILHPLGRMMATFYLADLWGQLQARCAASGEDEKQAARAVFGMELEEIGRRVAQQWGLPSALVNTLRHVPAAPVGEPLDHGDWLATVATLAAGCADALCADDNVADARLAALAEDYADMLGLDVSAVVAAAQAGHEVAAEEDAVVVRAVRRKLENTAAPAGKPAEAAAILRRGVADMREALHSASAGQLMSMALETVYQGLGFRRAIVFMRNRERAHYGAPMGFGDGVQDMLPRLAFGDAYQPDVFHVALANNKMVFVEYALNPAFVNKVPRWWKEALPMVRSFLVLPLTVNHNPVGFIYGDWDMAQPTAGIEQTEITELDALRSLLMQALEQCRHAEPAWLRNIL